MKGFTSFQMFSMFRARATMIAATIGVLSSPASAQEPSTKYEGPWFVGKFSNGSNTYRSATLKDDKFKIALYCIEGSSHWKVFISRDSDKEMPVNLQPVSLIYSIDSGASFTVSGTGWPNFRTDIGVEDRSILGDADDFVRALVSGKKQISFSIEPTLKMHVIKIDRTKEALSWLRSDCPLQ